MVDSLSSESHDMRMKVKLQKTIVSSDALFSFCWFIDVGSILLIGGTVI